MRGEGLEEVNSESEEIRGGKLEEVRQNEDRRRMSDKVK